LSTEQIAEIIRTFDWYNYGLNNVGDIEPQYAEYATELAEQIARNLPPAPPDIRTGTYRTGGHIGNNIYQQFGSEPSRAVDREVGVMFTPELGELAARGINLALAADAAKPDGPRVWGLPAEPGPEVRRLRPVESYPGDNSIWLDREADNSGWRVVMHGRAGEPVEWVRAYCTGAGSVWGGRDLVDATDEIPGGEG
jgi:hypothetical protein